MHGTLEKYCPKCRRPYAWEQVSFTRSDMRYDWHIDAWCQCGDVKDMKILGLAEKAFRRQQRILERSEMNKIFEQKLGRDLHRAIEDVLWKKMVSDNVTILFTAGYEHGGLFEDGSARCMDHESV